MQNFKQVSWKRTEVSSMYAFLIFCKMSVTTGLTFYFYFIFIFQFIFVGKDTCSSNQILQWTDVVFVEKRLENKDCIE